MAQTEVLFFRELKDNSVPLLEWIDELPLKVKAKCIERIDRLASSDMNYGDLRRISCATVFTNFGRATKRFTTACFISLQERSWLSSLTA